MRDYNTLTRYDYNYDTYGNVRTLPAFENPYQYSGEYTDTETGKVYLRARYYDPSMGRFTQEDTYWGEESNPLSLNQYSYCEGNPVMNSDPSGHDAVFMTDSDAAFGQGHSSLLLQDNSGVWWYCFFGEIVQIAQLPKEIKITKNINSDMIRRVNRFIRDNPAHLNGNISIKAHDSKKPLYGASKGADGYDWYTYIVGNFNPSYQKASEWARNNYRKYNLFSNNCAQMSIHILQFGYNNGRSFYNIKNVLTDPRPNIIHNNLSKTYGVFRLGLYSRGVKKF